MNAKIIALLVVGGLALIAVIAYTLYREQKRLNALRQFCASKGWQFVNRDNAYAVRWRCFPFFQGRNRQARAVITGSYGSGDHVRPFVAFDYSYVTDDNSHTGSSSTSSSTTHRYAICAIELPTYLPALEVTPENVLTRIGNAITGNAIQLESEDFNRRFKVTCPDAKFASDCLPPRSMEALLAHTGLHFRFEGRDLLCWETGETTTLKLLERLATLSAFVDGIPSFVWHDYQPDTGAASAQ